MAQFPGFGGPSATGSRAIDDHHPEDDADESVTERILGLTEMFPAPLRNGIGKLNDFAGEAIKKTYSFSRTWSWVFFSTSALAFAPALLMSELHQMEEATKMQQRQMLLGPNAAYSR